MIDTDPNKILIVFRIYAGNEMTPWLDKVQARSLAVMGENDGGCNSRLNRLAHKALPDSESIILPEYKHSILLEVPNKVVGTWIRFFRQS